MLPHRNDRILRALDAIDWYRHCLEDVNAGQPVMGLQEAKLGFVAAMDELHAMASEAVDA